MRRGLDLVASLICLAVLSPLLLVLAVILKVTSGGPVFSPDAALGRSGKQFRVYAFRTGLNGLKSGQIAAPAVNGARVTSFQRFLSQSRLSELPLLINVLSGDLSFVGPRMQSFQEVDGHPPVYRRLLAVRPGLINPVPSGANGSASAHPRDTTAGNNLDLISVDLRYVLRRNAWVDLRILFKELIRAVGVDHLFVSALSRSTRRQIPWVLRDVIVTTLAFYAALWLRLLDFPANETGFLSAMTGWIGPLAILYSTMNSLCGVNRRVWRFATAADVRPIIGAAAIATLIAIAGDLYLSGPGSRLLPLGVVVLGGVFSAWGMTLVRYRGRLLQGLSPRSRGAGERTRTIIFGAGESGQHLALRLLTNESGAAYDLLGFADDDPRKLGQRIHGLKVLGDRHDLRRIVANKKVDLIVIAINNIRGEDLRHVLTAAQQTAAQIRIIPNVFEVVSVASTAAFHRDVRVEDLLGRHPVQLDRPACERVIRGQVVLITGGCGSVGSELCKQVAQFEPKELIVLDNNETGLYDLELALRPNFPSLNLRIVVADVTRASRIDSLFHRLKPEVIFHTAAYKHVPLMERFPQEAVRVNIGGTAVVLEMALRHCARYFVLVSTDKAVEPHSVMGATKRIAEMLVVGDYGLRGAQGRTLCTAVRFGNVLGSRGSVVPTFTKQIDRGGPVTVTHPDMTRYFMDVSEAAGLIIQAASLTTGRDIFMLEMGERIRVDDLARKMIRMRGLRPQIDIPITYTGVRPGEKLHEELVFPEEGREATDHPLVYRLRASARLFNGQLVVAVRHLLELSKDGNDVGVVNDVMRVAGGCEAPMVENALDNKRVNVPVEELNGELRQASDSAG